MFASSPASGQSAKALFYSTSGAVLVASKPSIPTSQKPSLGTLGVGYFIRLKKGNGSNVDVLANRIFKSGERFQVGLKVSGPTYVYVLNADNTGRTVTLFPQPGQDALVDAMGTVFLPAKASFEFDGVPGIEQLTILISPTQIENPENFANGVKPDFVSDGKQPPLMASKAIVFSEDPTPSDGVVPASYVVKKQTNPKDVISLRLKLVHQ
jgi:hypothetical protein